MTFMACPHLKICISAKGRGDLDGERITLTVKSEEVWQSLKRVQTLGAERHAKVFPFRYLTFTRHLKTYTKVARDKLPDSYDTDWHLKTHGFRHAAITKLLRQGMDAVNVIKFSRHSSVEMLKHYNDRTKEIVEEAMDIMNE